MSDVPPLPAKLKLSASEVELGGSVEIVVSDSKDQVLDPAALPPGYSLDISPRDAGLISSGTLSVAEKPASPLSPVASVRLLGPGGAIVDQADLHLLIPWTAKGPRPVDSLPGMDGTVPWSSPGAQRARLILHDLLLQLPETFTAPLDGLPVVIRSSESYGGEYQAYPFKAEHIYIVPSAVDGDASKGIAGLNLASDSVTSADIAFAVLMVHEMGHAWQARASGGGLGNGLRMIEAFAALLVGWGVQVSAVAGLVAVLFPPVAFLALGAASLFWTMWSTVAVEGLTSQDEMSNWCAVSDWRQRNLTGLAIPILGPIVFATSEQLPNMPTALSAQIPGWLNWAIVDLHNTQFDVYQVHEQANEGGYFHHPERVPALTAGAGLAGVYGAMSPMEDFAESWTVVALRLSNPAPPVAGFAGNTDPLFQPNCRPSGGVKYVLPNAKRLKYFDSVKLTPSHDVVVGGSALSRAIGKLGGWKVQSVEADEDALAAAADEIKARDKFIAAHTAWNEGPAQALAKAEQAIRSLRQPPYDPARPFSFWAALECHGEGLHPLDRHGIGADPGDVATGADRRVYVVNTVEETGIKSMVGGLDADGKPPGIVEIEDIDLRYGWAPDPAPRKFCGDSEHGPAYRDIEAQLRTMIGWWGETEAGGSELGTLGRFAEAVAAVLDLPPVPEAPCERSPGRAAVARFHLLGSGLVPYDPALPARIGDVVVRYDGNTMGVVTRLDGGGRPLDVLSGGTTPEGGLGEEPGAVRMEHRIDHRDVHFLWRPDAKPRIFSMPNQKAAAAGLTDLDHSLRHLLAHEGAKRLLRQEEEVFPTEPLGLLAGLLVEGEPDALRRRALGLTVRSGDLDVLAQIAGFGEPRGKPDSLLPGDVLLLDSGEPAIAVQTGGAVADQVMRVKEQDELVLDPAKIGREDVAIAWQVSAEPRRIDGPDSGFAAFYGADRGFLFTLPARYRDTSTLELSLQGDSHTVIIYDGVGLGEVAASEAPEQVRRRLWDPRDIDDLAERCDTLGKGLVEGGAGGVPVGAWLFGAKGVQIVMAVDSQGRPRLVYEGEPSENAARLRVHSGRHDGKLWVPDDSPRAYVSGAAGAGYQDRNWLVGMLKLWGEHKAELSTPLFADSDLRTSGAFSPRTASALKRGPDRAEEWPEFLAANGTVRPGAPLPGDLLLFGDAERQAIMLDAQTMLFLEGDSGTVSVRKAAGFSGHWIPDA